MSTENTVEERNNDTKELRKMSPAVIPEQEAEECVILPQKKREKCMDLERILMEEELCNIEINFAQNLLKAQFKELNGLTSTLAIPREKGTADRKFDPKQSSDHLL